MKLSVLILVGPEPALFLHKIPSLALASAAMPNFAEHSSKTTEYFFLKLSGLGTQNVRFIVSFESDQF